MKSFLFHQRQKETNHSPFFIIGCVRSGTTLLRGILNMHPNLVSPEETHFYRLSDPFGTMGYFNFLRSNPTLKKHREIDGISEEMFEDILSHSVSRQDLSTKYYEAFKAVHKPAAQRWFDKTPQNVYGVLLMRNDFPDAKFVHIVRHPYNIVASLRLGKVLSISNIIGACNYWTEAVSIVNQLKELSPSAIFEFHYEDLVDRPKDVIADLLEFLGEENKKVPYKWRQVYKEKNQHREILSDQDRSVINDICGHWIRHYDYTMTT